MSNEATFREIHLPSSDNVNNYLALTSRKYADLEGNNGIVDLAKKKLENATD